MTRTLILIAVVLAGCGGGGKQETTTAAKADARPAPPAIPLDPFALLPAEPTELVVADLAGLRASAHFETLRGWAQLWACMPTGPDHPVLARTDRLVLAAYARPPGQTGVDVVVLGRGRYEPADAPDVLGEVAELAGHGPEPMAVIDRGRFRLFGDGARTSAVLAPHLIVVGNPAAVERVLAVADGQGERNVREGAAFGALGAAQWLADKHLAVLSTGEAPRGTQIGRGVRGLDRSLARAIDHRPRALALSLDDGVGLLWLSAVGDPNRAEQQIAEVRGALASAELILRLAGLPPIASRLTAQVEGTLARFELHLGDAEVAKLLAAANRALGAMARPACRPTGGGRV